MGNQASSCSCRLDSAFQPCEVAKVLLLDGRVLQFTKSVKAIHVLLQHPHHCLCPAQSLRLTHDSDGVSADSPDLPCSLLPDDELQLGRIYILLPFHTFRLFVAAAARSIPHDAVSMSRALISHSLPVYTQGGFAPKQQLSSFSSRRSSTWINGEKPISTQEEPTSNQAQPATIRAQSTSLIQAQSSADQAKPTLNHTLLSRKARTQINIAEKPTSEDAQPNSNKENPTPNQARSSDTQYLLFSRKNPLWVNEEELSTGQATSEAAALVPSINRTFISRPSFNSALRRANLPSRPASSIAARRSFELQRPHKGVNDIRRCRSWRPRLQAITEMSTW